MSLAEEPEGGESPGRGGDGQLVYLCIMAVFYFYVNFLLLVSEANNEPSSPSIIDRPEIDTVPHAQTREADPSFVLPLFKLALAAPVAYAFGSGR